MIGEFVCDTVNTPYSVSRDIGFTQQAEDLLVCKSFSFELRRIKRDMR